MNNNKLIFYNGDNEELEEIIKKIMKLSFSYLHNDKIDDSIFPFPGNKDYAIIYKDRDLYSSFLFNYDLEFIFKNNVLKGSGVTNVSTLPQSRNKGQIKQIFKQLLNKNYDDEVLISFLNPFFSLTPFYSSIGYGVCSHRTDLKVDTSNLIRIKLDEVAFIKELDYGNDNALKEWFDFNDSIKKYTDLDILSSLREIEKIKRHYKIKKLKEKGYYYFDGKMRANAVFYEDINNNTLNVSSINYDNLDSYKVILTFVLNYSKQFKYIKFDRFNPNINLDILMLSKKASKILQPDSMARIINLDKMMQLKYDLDRDKIDNDFSLTIHDEFIEENNKTIAIKKDGLNLNSIKLEKHFDMTISELSSLLFGAIDMDDYIIAKTLQGHYIEDKTTFFFKKNYNYISIYF